MRHIWRNVARLFVILLLALGPNAAAASANPFIRSPGATHENDVSVTPMVGVSGEYGLEGGIKLDVLLADAAFIPTLNNTVFLEGSFFVAKGGVFIAPELRWDFNLHPQWTVYGEGGLEVNLRPLHGDRLGLVAIAGAIWRIPGKSIFMRGEVDAGQEAARLGPVISF